MDAPIMWRGFVARVFAFVALAGLAACGGSSGSGVNVAPQPQASNNPNNQATQLAGLKSHINHIFIINQENWSFDSLYGYYPGANGYANAGIISQVDSNGNPINAMPPVECGGVPDPRFSPYPASVAPFAISQYVSLSAGTAGVAACSGSGGTGDPNHNFYIQQYEIDGGKMDRYLALPNGNGSVNGTSAGSLVMGYFNVANLPEGQIAAQYTLADNFHQSMFGGSFINNFAVFSGGLPPVFSGTPPAGTQEQCDGLGNPIQLGVPEGRITCDGHYLVNTSYTVQYPQFTTSAKIVPPQTMPDIGSQLTAAGVSWGWYGGGLSDALAGAPGSVFQPHHQAPLYFSAYAQGTQAMQQHIFDSSVLANQIGNGTAPSVVFVKSYGQFNEHPNYTNIICGQYYVAQLISEIQMSPIWKNSLIIVTYDEAGGHYDHVPPNAVDRWGPSTRVPALFISPWINRGYVDHTNYEMMSVLSTIEARFNLSPLTPRVAQAQPILAPFNFSQPAPQAYARQPLDLPACPVGVPSSSVKRGNPITEVNEIDE